MYRRFWLTLWRCLYQNHRWRKRRKTCGYEITLSSFEILSKPAEEYPLHVSSKKLGCSIETSMAHRSVALRHPEQRAVFKIAEGVVSAFREFMLNNNFTEIHSPKIVAAGAEGGANIFKLKYFDKDACSCLQSRKTQLYTSFERIYRTWFWNGIYQRYAWCYGYGNGYA